MKQQPRAKVSCAFGTWSLFEIGEHPERTYEMDAEEMQGYWDGISLTVNQEEGEGPSLEQQSF